MGMVNIQIRGSFGRPHDVSYSAMEGGHAFAITRAIQYLADQLPNAIRLDHELERAGENPPQADFGHYKQEQPV
jgi:hypothetical protein